MIDQLKKDNSREKKGNQRPDRGNSGVIIAKKCTG